MTAAHYFARNGAVFVKDGPWEARLTPAQTDSLLNLWDEANAVSLFNALWDACQAAGYIATGHCRKPTLRVVESPLRAQLLASLALVSEDAQ